MLTVNGNILLCCVVLRVCNYCCWFHIEQYSATLQIKQINLVLNSIYSEIIYYPR
jgi:hypothetical protein